MSRLHEVFDYVDGRLYDKNNKERDTCINSGYRNSFIDKTIYRTHRLIWKMHHGNDPHIIDHINLDKLDNRIENLRDVNDSLNVLNVRDSRYTKKFPRGIRLHGNKWRARISYKNERYHLGLFKTIEEAQQAYNTKMYELYHTPVNIEEIIKKYRR
jgi:hypothetical protein